MRLLLLVLAASLARADDSPPVQRYLESLKLGDKLEHVKIIYPPTRDWSRSREPRGVDRVLIQRGQAKYVPEAAESLTLDFKHGRLVRLEVLYDRAYSKKKPLERVVEDLSLDYGEPRRSGDSYFWWDSSTVLVAAQTTVPDPKGNGEEVRTTLAVMDRSHFDPLKH